MAEGSSLLGEATGLELAAVLAMTGDRRVAELCATWAHIAYPDAERERRWPN